MNKEPNQGEADRASRNRELLSATILSLIGGIGAILGWVFTRISQGDISVAISLWAFGIIIVAIGAALIIASAWRDRGTDAFWTRYFPYFGVLALSVTILVGLAVPLFLPLSLSTNSIVQNNTPTAVSILTPQPTDTLTTTVVGGTSPVPLTPAPSLLTVSPTMPVSATVELPTFEVTALNTLDHDPNAYEITDWLISTADDLESGNLDAEYPIQVSPHYTGTQQFQEVVALIDGDGETGPLVRPLWDTLTNISERATFTLTLKELVDASGIKVRYPGYDNLFADGMPPFPAATLTIKIVSLKDKDIASEAQVIEIRNAPWDFRSELVLRDGKQFIDSSIYNFGGSGLFTIVHNVRKVNGQGNSDNHAMYAGTDAVKYWYSPEPFVTIDQNEYYTTSVELPTTHGPGVYYVETFPIKLQPSIRPQDEDVEWSNIYTYSRWWLTGQYQSAIEMFVYNPFPADPGPIADEHRRMLDEDGIDLGLALSPREAITSPTGTVGYRQFFQQGEIIVHDGVAYSLYGPLLDHYRSWINSNSPLAEYVGFPLTTTQLITSSTGMTATMMTFQDKDYPLAPAAIYATAVGQAGIRAGFRTLHLAQGGHAGALGLPIADEEYYPECLLQRFEHGYLVYPTPRTVNGESSLRNEIIRFPISKERGGALDCTPGDAAIAAEWIRLYNEGTDLGFAIAPTETVTSPSGLTGYRQVFEDGEIVIQGDQAYSVYGELYKHYKHTVEDSSGWPFFGSRLFPITAVQDIGDGGKMIEFEGPNIDAPRVVVYTSPRGAAVVFGEILEEYETEGGPEGRLGWPISNRFFFPYGDIQPFHRGYIVLPSPLGEGTEHDYSQPPITFAYRGSSSLVLEVAADQGWQDAVVWLRAGDTITVEQLAGSWTHSTLTPRYDADGIPITSTDGTLPLPTAPLGALLGRMGDGPAVFLGKSSAVTADQDERLLLKMNDFDYRDNAGFVTIEIEAPRHSTPLQVLRFDYQDSPLTRGHGWALEDEKEGVVTFTPIEDEFVGRAMRIRGAESYGIDHDVNDASMRLADTIDVVAALEENGLLYASVGLRNNGEQECHISSGWLKFVPGLDNGASPTEVSENEWKLPVESTSELGGKWQRYQIDLTDAVLQTFGQQGCALSNLQKYRLRGDMDIERIAAYERHP